MSERKVLNKYYPADFDPNKIPRMRREKNAMYTIRIMAPFNMRCNTCGEYIYKGKKFNSRKENVEDEFYLGLYIFRFYIRCPRCIAVISFKTDPENTDYTLEAGATRNFEAARTAEELAKKEAKEKEEEEANNPMKVLENRTKASQNEMAMLETLEELKDLNKRQASVDYESMVEKYRRYEEQLRELQDEEDEKFIKSVFGEGSRVKRLEDDDEEESEQPKKKMNKLNKPTDILAQNHSDLKNDVTIGKNIKSQSQRSKLMGLVKRKPAQSGDLCTSVKAAFVAESVKTDGNGPVSDTRVSKDTSVYNENSNATKSDKDIIQQCSPVSNSQDKESAPPSGLSLLGNYSDSENSESD